MDRLQSMKVFTTVVAHGGFTAASKYLHMTPQMVSHHIRRLENYLSVSLFTRTTRQVHLTHIGHQYLVHCRQVLAQIEEGEAGIREFANSPSGLLRICAPLSFGSIKVAPSLVEFSQKFPNIRVDLSLSDDRQDLIAEGIDVAFRIGKLANSNFIARPLEDYSMMLAASPAYLAKKGHPEKVEDLKKHNCLLQKFDHTANHWVIEENNELATVVVQGGLRVNHGVALLHTALADGGITLQPKVLLEQAIEQGRLVPVLTDTPLPKQSMHLLYQPSAKKDAKVMAFVQYALERWRAV